MKEGVCTAIGVCGSIIANVLGGWDAGIITLIILMSADYVTGLIVAGVFKNSTKSETGALESKAGFKGLCRKGTMLLIVLVAYRLDISLDTDYIRNAAIIAFDANELLSLIENAGLMGIKMPAIITKAVDILQKKSEGVK